MGRRLPRTFDAGSRSDPDFPWLEIDERFRFPDPEETGETVVAVGGNLSPGMIVSAYSQGIFPWFNEDDPLYWQSPDPRFVILPENFRVPRRLSRSMKNSPFTILADTSFERVINFCSGVARPGQDGSWITDDMIDAYVDLHRSGIAHSVEAWMDGDLVGGFYGVILGSVFFGESMFTRASDAAKTAFAVFARAFFSDMGGRMIDSQVYTDNIARFGGANISRSAYLRKLAENLPVRCLGLSGRREGVAVEAGSADGFAADASCGCSCADSAFMHGPLSIEPALQPGLWTPDFFHFDGGVNL